jgi:YcxB-like protein
MRVDYEISEKDYLDGQRLAIQNSPVIMVRWTRLVMPSFGALLAVFLLHGLWTQPFSVSLLPGMAFSLFLLLLPFLNIRKQKTLYANSNALHGQLTLDVDDSGIQFEGPITSAKVNWAYFGRFFEDHRAFVLYQKNQAIFQMVPKRALSADQVALFRQYLEQNVRPRGEGN